ncbi:MAG: hypothetical protein RLZZ324_937 [Candidatus Parcubacteria bacterium]|jgi:hypothetical protein
MSQREKATDSLPLRDTARWNGVQIRRYDFGAADRRQRHNGQHVFGGVAYRTGSEAHVAELLTKHRIPFTHDVRFDLICEAGKPRIHVPDFVFNRQAFVWLGSKGREPMLIHGIEVKARCRDTGKFPERAWENVRILRKLRGINILLMSDEAAARHWRQGSLPIEPLPEQAR